jgi:hypothetical protein
MSPFDSRQEEQFYEAIVSFIDQRQIAAKYGVVVQPLLSDYTTLPYSPTRRLDFMVLKGPYPYIIVEVVGSQRFQQDYVRKDIISPFALDLELTGADYFVVTDLEQLLIYDSQRTEKPQPAPFSAFFELFDEGLDEAEILNLKERVQREIQMILEEKLPALEQASGQISELRSLLLGVNLTEKLAYNEEGRFFYFATNPQLSLEDFENLFFQALLRPVTEEAVCRYTTLESVYYMVEGISFRMVSHIAMNDRGEIDYVDKYINNLYKPLQSLSLKEMQQLNNSYISSCTLESKEDDLTMYRLYGDDSKGVCLRFSVTNGLHTSNMMIRKISYAQSRQQHLELDLLKAIITRLSGFVKINFRFLYLDIWKHFFKSFDYMVEQEVRVLYLDTPSGICFQEGLGTCLTG